MKITVFSFTLDLHSNGQPSMVILDFSLILFVGADLEFASKAISPQILGGSADKVVTILMFVFSLEFNV
jgi:hypothetical protein